MNCTWPKPITDRDLLAYLAGEGPSDSAKHVKTCPACRERVQDLRASDAWLRQMLYRAECPGAQVISDFRQGFLAPDEEQAMTAHLQRCPHCQAELAKLDRFLAEIEPTFGPRWMSAVRVLVARLMTWPQAGPIDNGLERAAPRLAYGAVRGHDDHLTQVYQAASFQIILDIEVDAARPDRRHLQGLVTNADGMVEESLSDASLVGTDTARAVSTVDELGNFTFKALAPGVYNLTLAGPGLELRVKEIDLR